uniref:2Fe-2S ferredoxin-type domain-containing protein n=1 Tax=Timema cristinae TaxID=61476 RepID=A0A7R9C9V7_TIMCR|nr:unnamed protein product [Timema cristinae]
MVCSAAVLQDVKLCSDTYLAPMQPVVHACSNSFALPAFVVRLCGTKLGCGEGGCGACTVMVSRYDRGKKQVTDMNLITSVDKTRFRAEGFDSDQPFRSDSVCGKLHSRKGLHHQI